MVSITKTGSKYKCIPGGEIKVVAGDVIEAESIIRKVNYAGSESSPIPTNLSSHLVHQLDIRVPSDLCGSNIRSVKLLRKTSRDYEVVASGFGGICVLSVGTPTTYPNLPLLPNVNMGHEHRSLRTGDYAFLAEFDDATTPRRSLKFRIYNSYACFYERENCNDQ